MSISSVTSSAASGIAQPRPAGPGKEIRDGVHQLKDAVTAGDLKSIQDAYDSLSKLQSRSGSASDADSPLTKMLSVVGEALQSGDVSKVQQAFAANGPKGAGGQGGPGGVGGADGPPPGPPPGGAGGPPDAMKDAMGSLSQSLQSGDLTGAQKTFSSLAPRGSQGVDLLA
ncbi:hypothetical protein [Azospirillum formosense]|uniref:hypothetical protein n=1 Tax=Azospirillum formosense TaxID=861533 RepID=UPI00338D6CCE